MNVFHRTVIFIIKSKMMKTTFTMIFTVYNEKFITVRTSVNRNNLTVSLFIIFDVIQSYNGCKICSKNMTTTGTFCR